MANETSELHVPWPTHPDGSNKRMGEMTAEEQRDQWRAAALRFAAYLARTTETHDESGGTTGAPLPGYAR